MKFSEIDLKPEIQTALKRMGFDEMTPIQEATYSTIAQRRDLCALAETGSGKTAACAVPLVQMVDISLTAIQGLVIVPTRELCLQYVTEIEKIAGATGVAPFATYGGAPKDIQVAKLKHGVHILVATPGRLIDLTYDGVIDYSEIRCAVLDEADELLKVGFLEDIEFIMSCIIHEHQTLLFAATMAGEIKKLVDDVLRDPVHVSLIDKQAVPQSIEHYFIAIAPNRKKKELMARMADPEVRQAIIFCNARHKVDKLFKDLRGQVENVEYIHGGLGQDKRSSIFRRFKAEKIRYMIATDVAGRGLDFSRVTHIFNWDFPRDSEGYTHRTGRSGRMGRRGRAISFVSRRDLANVARVLKVKGITPRWIGEDPLAKGAPAPKKPSSRGRDRGRGGRRRR